MSLFHSISQLWSRKSQSKQAAARRRNRQVLSKRGLLFEGLEERSMLAITQIALSNFTAPRVLDFQSVPTGPIATNAAAFQAIGISSVTGTSDTDLDSYSTGLANRQPRISCHVIRVARDRSKQWQCER